MTVNLKDVIVNSKWAVRFPEHIASLSNTIWKFWEKERMTTMYAVVRPTDTILDIGTSNGDMSAVFATWLGLNGRIILVEPSADFWPLIKVIFEANNLTPFKCFDVLIGNETTDNWGRHQAQRTSLYPDSANAALKLETGFMHVNEHPKEIPVVKVDDLGVGNVDVITMDIEGTEYEALQGAEQTIRNCRPVLFVSVHAESMWREHHHTIDDLNAMMQSWGYIPTYLAYDHEQHWMYKPEGKRV